MEIQFVQIRSYAEQYSETEFEILCEAGDVPDRDSPESIRDRGSRRGRIGEDLTYEPDLPWTVSEPVGREKGSQERQSRKGRGRPRKGSSGERELRGTNLSLQVNASQKTSPSDPSGIVNATAVVNQSQQKSGATGSASVSKSVELEKIDGEKTRSLASLHSPRINDKGKFRATEDRRLTTMQNKEKSVVVVGLPSMSSPGLQGTHVSATLSTGAQKVEPRSESASQSLRSRSPAFQTAMADPLSFEFPSPTSREPGAGVPDAQKEGQSVQRPPPGSKDPALEVSHSAALSSSFASANIVQAAKSSLKPPNDKSSASPVTSMGKGGAKASKGRGKAATSGKLNEAVSRRAAALVTPEVNKGPTVSVTSMSPKSTISGSKFSDELGQVRAALPSFVGPAAQSKPPVSPAMGSSLQTGLQSSSQFSPQAKLGSSPVIPSLISQPGQTRLQGSGTPSSASPAGARLQTSTAAAAAISPQNKPPLQSSLSSGSSVPKSQTGGPSSEALKAMTSSASPLSPVPLRTGVQSSTGLASLSSSSAATKPQSSSALAISVSPGSAPSALQNKASGSPTKAQLKAQARRAKAAAVSSGLNAAPAVTSQTSPAISSVTLAQSSQQKIGDALPSTPTELSAIGKSSDYSALVLSSTRNSFRKEIIN
jgi:hypothetical protein